VPVVPAAATVMHSRSARRRRRVRALAAAAGVLAGLRLPSLPTGFDGAALAA
jgi:hypothetical protein